MLSSSVPGGCHLHQLIAMEHPAQESFATLTDRLLPAPVAHAAWCPTMDLVAVAFTDGRIAVHRLNWQRLWLVTPDAAPTALAWTPSGDVLAIGRADGAVCLLEAETGDVVGESHFKDSGWQHGSHLMPHWPPA